VARRVRMIHGDAERLDDRTGSRTCGQQFGASNLVISFDGFASRRAAAPCRQRSHRSPASIATGASLKTRPTDGAGRGSMPASCVSEHGRVRDGAGERLRDREQDGERPLEGAADRSSHLYRRSRHSNAHTRTRRSIAPRRRPMDTSSVSRLEIAQAIGSASVTLGIRHRVTVRQIARRCGTRQLAGVFATMSRLGHPRA